MCCQEKGDLVVVPLNWWHGTCNQAGGDGMTFGLGSQGPDWHERPDRVHFADAVMVRIQDPAALAKYLSSAVRLYDNEI